MCLEVLTVGSLDGVNALSLMQVFPTATFSHGDGACKHLRTLMCGQGIIIILKIVIKHMVNVHTSFTSQIFINWICLYQCHMCPMLVKTNLKALLSVRIVGPYSERFRRQFLLGKVLISLVETHKSIGNRDCVRKY